MILSGLEIERHLGININIEPFNRSQLNPNSYNLRLHNELIVYDMEQCPTLCESREIRDGIWERSETTYLDMKKDNPTKTIIIPEEGLIIRPGVLYLGRTVERTEISPRRVPKEQRVPLVGCLDGRSSIGRLGIDVHATAGFGDIGFEGYWTMEISCIHPVKIYPNIEIAQIYFHTVAGVEYTMYESGKYQNNDGVQSSRMFMDFDKP